MQISSLSAEATSHRETFFKLLFGPNVTGYVGLAFLDRKRKQMSEEYFEWPKQLPELLRAIDFNLASTDVYYCPQLLGAQKRTKENVKLCTAIWADLDECDPSNMLVQPSIVIESSRARYQALWVLEDPMFPGDAETLSKRIAYFHAGQGADRSGWDLTQLLRVPYTPNNKYTDTVELVSIQEINRNKYRAEDFDEYPEVANSQFLSLPMPTEVLQDAPEDIMQKYRHSLNPICFRLYSMEPEKDWSTAFWKLQMLLFEAGMEREEVFAIVRLAKCNKYARDNRPDDYVWKDVCRAYLKHMENSNAVLLPDIELAEIISAEELESISEREGFVERYIEWASGLGDAAVQYHQAGAFTILGALLAGRVRLPTSFGVMIPNLWFMILGDTTLTRKSTAMDIAMDLIDEVDSDATLATDGSIEGMMSALATRPGRSSIFLRDEFSGLIEAMTKKDYMAGMAEMLTKLYDGKMQKRILKKETIEVREPVLLILAGGIRNRVQGLLTFDHVSSGFMPRFVFVTAESDVDRMEPLGPPTERDLGNRENLLHEMRDIVAHYHTEASVPVGNTGVTIPVPVKWSATLTPEAWQRYNKLEKQMLDAGMLAERPELMTPMFDRLSKSVLKAAVLIAAAGSRTEKVVVEVEDLLAAIKYCTMWRQYAIEVINGVGKTTLERDLDRILGSIARSPGVTRGKLMQSWHLTAKGADQAFDTLLQRGLITSQRVGKATHFYLVGAKINANAG